jgi:hypothetical protein
MHKLLVARGPLMVVFAAALVGAAVVGLLASTSPLPSSYEKRTFFRADIIARYCPFSAEELSRALGRPVVPHSVTLGPPRTPKMISCVFTTDEATNGELSLGYFLRDNPAAFLRYNRQFVEARGASVAGDDACLQ